MTDDSEITLRPGLPADLDAINRVVEGAVMTWRVAERVKRLALPGYRYAEGDFADHTFTVAERGGDGVVGVAAMTDAEARDLPAGSTGVYLHGLYVLPALHRRGVGARLFRAAAMRARECGAAGVLVKAQRDAEAFFHAQGMRPLEHIGGEPLYPRPYWLCVATLGATA
jgi:predicted N-acetyltransferase YhbS